MRKRKKILSGQTSETMRYALEHGSERGWRKKRAAWKDIGSAGKQLLLRHCPEVPTGIFPLFSVLPRPMIPGDPRGLYRSIIRRESIMAEQ